MATKHKKKQLLSSKETVFSSSELSKVLGSRPAIRKAVDANQLVALGAGFYSTPDLDPSVAQVLVVARFYPQAVISGLSALVIHNLSDEKLEKVTVDVPKSRLIRNAILQARRVEKGRFIGIEKLDYHGHSIRIYDVERLLCDAYRVDRGFIFFKALKRYLKVHKPQYEKIARYDKALGTKVLRSVQQELAND